MPWVSVEIPTQIPTRIPIRIPIQIPIQVPTPIPKHIYTQIQLKELAPNKTYMHIYIYIFRFVESKSLSRFSRTLASHI